MANFTKQQLKDEAFDFCNDYKEKYWMMNGGESYAEFTNRVDKIRNYVDDFVQFMIDRNFKR